MRILVDQMESSVRSDTLVVLLAPAQARPEDLKARGFVADIRERGIRADVLLPDHTHAGFIGDFAPATLQEWVVGPARSAGYRNIWLAGVSLGAFTALHYAAVHANELGGILLIAPYPGTGDVLAEIERAGGPSAWSRSTSASVDGERAWWHWLCRQSSAECWQTAVYVGTGLDDRFFRGQRLLFDLLPKERVQLIAGRHDWATWRTLWRHWLDNGPLAGRCHQLGQPM